MLGTLELHGICFSRCVFPIQLSRPKRRFYILPVVAAQKSSEGKILINIWPMKTILIHLNVAQLGRCRSFQSPITRNWE